MLQAIADTIKDWGPLALFVALSLVTLGSAVLVVTARRVTHACVSLLPCFVGIAGLYAMLASPVMLAFQLLIYAGGIMVLMLFAIFLLERRTGPIVAANHHVVPAALVALVTAVVILRAVPEEKFEKRFLPAPPFELQSQDMPSDTGKWYAWDAGQQPSTNVRRTGFYFLTYYLLPFELTSLILVIAMVGAIVIARREKGWVAAGRIPAEERSQESRVRSQENSSDGAAAATTEGGEGEA